MSKGDPINLINEFTECQSDNDYIVLTTFCFDPFFFDKYLFHKIRANNPESEILVLIDGNQYTQSLERFTNETGRKYHLIPIYLKNGVFHPKVFLFVSRERKVATIYIGSSNLTLTGFTRNAEIITKIKYSEESIDLNINSIKDFFNNLVKYDYIREEKAIRIINQSLESLPVEGKIDENPEYRIIHNTTTPILPKMIEDIDQTSYYETVILAPFFASNESVISHMLGYILISKFRVALQKNNHNLASLHPYISYFTKNGTCYEIDEAKFANDESRTFHSKLIYLKGGLQYLLVGSPNMTRRALLENATNGNVECAVFFKGIQAQKIIENLKLIEVGDVNEIVNSRNMIKHTENSSNIIKIYSAEFEESTKSVHIITEPLVEDVLVCLSIEGQNESLEEYFDLSEGEFRISTPKGIPIEISIFSKEKSARRRIYYDQNNIFRNISRTKGSFKQISDRLSHDFTLDISEIHAIIIGFTKRNEVIKNVKLDDERKKTVLNKSDCTQFPKPSKIYNIHSTTSFLRHLSRLYQSIHHHQNLKHNYEDINLDEIDGEETCCRVGYQYHKYETSNNGCKISNKDLDKLIKYISDILIQSVIVSDEDNPKDAFVHAQAIFVTLVSRILGPYQQIIGNYRFDNIIQILENNMKDIDHEDVTKSSAIDLFKHLLIINYCYNLRIHAQFMSTIFSHVDFLDIDVYYDVKKSVKDYQDNYYSDNSLFLLQHFQDHFCSLITYIFSSSTIENGPVEIIQAIVEAKDQEFTDFLGKILLKLKYGAWDQKRARFSLYTPRKNILELKRGFSDIDTQKTAYIDDFLVE